MHCRKFISDVVRKNLDISFCLVASNKTLKTKRKLQHITSLRFSDKTEQALYETFVKHVLQAETTCPGAGIEFSLLVANSNVCRPIKRIKNKNDLSVLLTEAGLSSKAKNVILTSLEFSNMNSSLSIGKSSTQKTHIEIVEGYTFHLKPLLKFPSTEYKDVKVVCIDGYIESISEIHHLLTFLSETKVTCLLIVRGVSDDVLHTIKVNNDRKTLCLVPYVANFDLNEVNTLVDISIVSGTDIVSSVKGDLISSLPLDKIGTVDSCTIHGEVIRLKNRSCKKRVKEHIENIKKTLEERPEIETFLSKRLKSLASSCIDIRIPDDINYASLSQEIDEGIRIVTSILSNKYDPSGVAREVFDSYVKSSEDLTPVFYFADEDDKFNQETI